MDFRTSNFYSKNAESLYKDYINVKGGISRYFDVIFQNKETVLDIGSGSGRDILILLEKGHDAYGIEPCNELRMLAEYRNPVLKG
ncbi:MAG: class I SAM-dependent methyltransferase, partial [Candidatus Muirbacterium halophilum]|nr:class I SAM-dependent methyltransferase [Candidatus Muirbacterium halophilum]